jgi:hypothetical protein
MKKMSIRICITISQSPDISVGWNDSGTLKSEAIESNGVGLMRNGFLGRAVPSAPDPPAL